jgi:hypothetical protein
MKPLADAAEKHDAKRRAQMAAEATITSCAKSNVWNECARPLYTP